MDYLFSDELLNKEKYRFLIDHRIKASKGKPWMLSMNSTSLRSKSSKYHAQKPLCIPTMKPLMRLKQGLFSIASYDVTLKHIATLPSISDLTAQFILSEGDDDISVFAPGKHPYSYTRPTLRITWVPIRKKSFRCFSAGQYLKFLLIHHTLTAAKSWKISYCSAKCQHIAKQYNKKKTTITIARMILTSIYHILMENEAFPLGD